MRVSNVALRLGPTIAKRLPELGIDESVLEGRDER